MSSQSDGPVPGILKPLIQEMLAGVRRHRETTLLAGFDSCGLVANALQSVAMWSPGTSLNQLPSLEAAESVCRRTVVRALESHSNRPSIDAEMPCGGTQADWQDGGSPTANSELCDDRVAKWFAVWLEEFSIAMNEVHPKAIDIVILRVEACDTRQIAQRLGLPMRLVMRVVGDIVRVCEGAAKPCESAKSR